MQINANDMSIDHAQILGQTLLPADGDSQWAVYRRGTRAVGILFETGRANPYLRVTPALAPLPEQCREGFERWQFDNDDERVLDFKVDNSDGEVFFRRDLTSLEPAYLEAKVADALDYAFSCVIPQVDDYVKTAF